VFLYLMNVNVMKWKAQEYDKDYVQLLTSYLSLEDFNPDYSKKRIVVQTNTGFSMLKLARKGGDIYEKYIELTRNDYVMISHMRGYSVFIKRTDYHPERIASYEHVRRYLDLMYTITSPPPKRRSSTLPNRLLVLFSHMNGGSGYDSNNAMDRQFVQFFTDVQRSLVKNVYVLRLADTNLSHGSYFVNTPNFPNYENLIQDLIKKVAKNNNISLDDVILYGGSKGGAGALVHASLGNYHAVAGDPIINAAKYNANKDWHFVKNFREANLTDKIINQAESNTKKMYVFASKAHPFNYEHSVHLSKQSNGLIEIIDLSKDSMIKTHPHITAQSVPEQITLINLLFDGNKILGSIAEKLLYRNVESNISKKYN